MHMIRYGDLPESVACKVSNSLGRPVSVEEVKAAAVKVRALRTHQGFDVLVPGRILVFPVDATAGDN